jgi:hypothetical protein
MSQSCHDRVMARKQPRQMLAAELVTYGNALSPEAET